MNDATEGLQVTKLTKTYPGGIRALDKVDLTVAPGLYGLLGPNGAGKSTLMRTLATLQQPDSGSITLDGVDTLADPDYVRRRLGYLPQQIGTYPTVTGRQLLERFAWLKGRTDKAERRREVAQLLERVNLRADADRAVATYSGGMLRRFGIALALAGNHGSVVSGGSVYLAGNLRAAWYPTLQIIRERTMWPRITANGPHARAALADTYVQT